MTSILDQYEQASLPSQTVDFDTTDQSQYDYLNMMVDESTEHQLVFNLKKFNSAISSTYRLQYMCVGKDTLAYVTTNNILFTYNWKTLQKIEEIDVGKTVGGSCKVKNLYLDPVLGRHLLIPVVSGNGGSSLNSTVHDLYYLNSSSNNSKLKQIIKFRNHELTAVGWNRIFVTNQCSSCILLGTSKGLIFEIELNLESEKLFQSSVETYCRQVFDLGKNSTSTTITGIEFHRFSNVPENYFILVTTSNRLYQFIGKTNVSEEKLVLSHIFNTYLNTPEGFIEFPNESSSALRVFCSSTNGESKPNLFAWHIGDVGIFFGKVHHRLTRNTLRENTVRFKYCNRNILELREREIFEDVFPENASNEMVPILSSKPQYVYAGFDPTAESLHVGNLLILINLLHWQRAGHNVITLIGNATARIGDPSGRTSDRKEQLAEVLRQNSFQIKKNIERIFSNHEKYIWSKKKDGSPLPPVIFVDNEEWYKGANVVTFISKMGRHFRIGSMLRKESVKTRIEGKGLNYSEFSYQLFQAIDWLHLFQKYECRFQIGGKDQMGNILAGAKLISRVLNESVYGLTLPLVTNDDGEKFGKSLRNTVWLDEILTSPFDFYQFFIETDDKKVEQLLKLFTLLPLGNIKRIMTEHQKNPEQKIAQIRLAEEVTLLVHGEEGLKSAQNSTSILCAGNLDILSTMSVEDLTKILKDVTIVTLPWKTEYSILDFALDIPCFRSKSDALKLIKAGAFSINLQKVENPYEVLNRSVHVLPNNIIVVRLGEKTYWIVQFDT